MKLLLSTYEDGSHSWTLLMYQDMFDLKMLGLALQEERAIFREIGMDVKYDVIPWGEPEKIPVQ